MQDYCFVIQPFDGGEFDKRYNDVISPAIKSVGIEPYRVDEDSSASIPIEAIEEKIKNSRFCIADISTDNPNVWYEVGYALALGKDIILISKERSSFPFDIRHRLVISYKTVSLSDFTELTKKVVDRASAILKQPMKINSPVSLNADIAGLDFQEISFIGAILKNQDSPNSCVSAWAIKEEMKRSGLNEIAFNLSARKLLKKGILTCDTTLDQDGEYLAYFITESGDDWVLNNADKFNTDVKNVTIKFNNGTIINDDDVPF